MPGRRRRNRRRQQYLEVLKALVHVGLGRQLASAADVGVGSLIAVKLVPALNGLEVGRSPLLSALGALFLLGTRMRGHKGKDVKKTEDNSVCGPLEVLLAAVGGAAFAAEEKAEAQLLSRADRGALASATPTVRDGPSLAGVCGFVGCEEGSPTATRKLGRLIWRTTHKKRKPIERSWRFWRLLLILVLLRLFLPMMLMTMLTVMLGLLIGVLWLPGGSGVELPGGSGVRLP